MKKHWNRPEATAETIVEGWLHTGDGAVVDEDGFVYIQDGLKDVAVSRGGGACSAELEEVISRESENWGESPSAIVVRSDRSRAGEAILDFHQDKLAPFKQPVAIRLLDQLPCNPWGQDPEAAAARAVQLRGACGRPDGL